MTTQIQLGDITIHRVVEQEAPIFAALEFFPTLTQGTAGGEPRLAGAQVHRSAGKIVLCIQSYIVRTPHHTILVDSCVGNHKPRPTRPFWNMLTSDRYEKNLAATGPRRRRHRLRHVHAPARRPRRLEHAAGERALGADLPEGQVSVRRPRAGVLDAKEKEDPANHPWITDSVLPIVHAKRAEVVKSDHRLNELVQLIPTPGHTIDHFSVHVGKAGQDAVITGDMIHSPIQARYPELGMRVDYDSKQAGAIPAQAVRALLRYPHPDVHGALPLAIHRAHVALGQRLQIRVCLSRAGPLLDGHAVGTCRKHVLCPASRHG